MSEHKNRGKLLWMFLMALLLAGFYQDAQGQCNTDNSNTTLSSSTTWNTPHTIPGNLVIDSNKVLTIRSTVTFAKGASLVIKRGGRVNLYSGAVLTHACTGSLWDGIQVQGNRYRAQRSGSAWDPGQGILVTDSSALIKFCYFTQSTDGGVISAKHTTWENCRKSIEVLGYKNPLDSEANTIYFGECDFLVNDTLPGYGNKSISQFMALNNVRGITIAGCRFINSIALNRLPAIDRGTGIGAIDASFILLAGGTALVNTTTGCHTATGRYNEFQNLYTGIDYASVDPVFHISINQSHFLNNFRSAIELRGEKGSKIKYCNFEYDSNFFHVSGPASLFTVNLRGSTQFEIDSNKFNILSEPLSGSDGKLVTFLNVTNSGSLGGYINNNICNGSLPPYFKTIAIQLRFNNPHLAITCNRFANNERDIFMNLAKEHFLSDQGSDSMSTGNEHTTAGGSGYANVNYYAIGTGVNTFAFYDDASKPLTSVAGLINVIRATTANPCNPVGCISR